MVTCLLFMLIANGYEEDMVATSSGAGANDLDNSMFMVDEDNLNKIMSIYKRGRIARNQEMRKVAKEVVVEEEEEEIEGSGNKLVMVY